MDSLLEGQMEKESLQRNTDSEPATDSNTGVVGEDSTARQETASSDDELNLNVDQDGTAKLKPEFIDKERIRKNFNRKVEDVKQKEETQKDNTKVDEPPTKKIRKEKRGQNKHRPRDQKIDSSERLCPSISNETVCHFAERCKYEHSVEAFMAKKPPDISDKCYLFEKYGKCHYGMSCRFGGCHISENNKNVVDHEKYKADLKPEIINVLAKDLQRQLWKKKYKFEKADEVLRKLMKQNKSGQQTVKDNTQKAEAVSAANGSSRNQEIKDDKGEFKEQGCHGDGQEHLTDGQSGANHATGQSEGDVQKTSTNEPADVIQAMSKNETTDVISEMVKSEGSLNVQSSVPQHSGTITDEDLIRLRHCEKKKIDFSDKLYLAPLTTVGNLPYRRICKKFGVDITCGEMAMCTNLLQGQLSEWALLKRHCSEDVFGVQLCGSFPDTMTKCAELLTKNIDVDFIDINVGCPIDLVFRKGGGCALMGRLSKFEQIVTGMTSVMDVPLTVKMRTGIQDKNFNAHKVIPKLRDWGVSMVTLHGRSREQRYTKLADWDYINDCAKAAHPMPLYGNGDILSYEDAMRQRQHTGISGVMIARGALIKPWVFTEIKEQRHWDISSAERLDMLQDFVNYGLEHWGSDQQGVDRTRRFLLEWLSFLYRYIPVGILERVPQRINERPPYYFGRNDLETLMASNNCGDWIKISEMLLGPVPNGFQFLPKHRANSYK
ncbi:tRNA-dihydrouridine(47) synthase [NAD(P)(+)]-like [Ptychodera flava]|uniref:tRNA-dihydrouridine(47) synthase [NAD(P)(+)]-like n=1 Tax=Ptychodera flava TaxID=63121 RepID=UPI00396A1E02